uniref:Uncharacterized protein n=1 Tax=Oryza nivara TaxID=4536 RepID=A0A0E0J1K8_ORYNI
MHRIIGNGEATDGGALDTEDADELDAICYLDERWGMGKNNFGETRLLQGRQEFDGSMCQVPRFNYFLSYHGNLVNRPKILC